MVRQSRPLLYFRWRVISQSLSTSSKSKTNKSPHLLLPNLVLFFSTTLLIFYSYAFLLTSPNYPYPTNVLIKLPNNNIINNNNMNVQFPSNNHLTPPLVFVLGTDKCAKVGYCKDFDFNVNDPSILEEGFTNSTIWESGVKERLRINI